MQEMYDPDAMPEAVSTTQTCPWGDRFDVANRALGLDRTRGVCTPARHPDRPDHFACHAEITAVSGDGEFPTEARIYLVYRPYSVVINRPNFDGIEAR